MITPARAIKVSLGLALCMVVAACGPRGRWILEEVDGRAVSTPHPGISGLQFSNGYVAGRGCNNFSGKYRIDGDRMTVGSLQHNLMACAGPYRWFDDYDDMMMSHLNSTRHFQIRRDGKLLLTGPAGSSLLLSRLSKAAVDPARYWQVQSPGGPQR